MRRFLRFRLGLILASALFAGCTQHDRPHRPGDSALLSVDGNEGRLAVIELDDQGSFWLPDQLQTAIDMITVARQGSQGGVIVVTYVHGWHHDASAGNQESGNLEQFRELLARWQAQEEKRTVLGVYLAWRGESFDMPAIRHLTFFDRRAAAQQVGGPHATEAIFRLLRVTKAPGQPETTTAASGPGAPQNLSIFIGHSFGAMILERALRQALVGLAFGAGAVNTGTDSPGTHFGLEQREPVPVLPDLVLFINSAAQALDASQMIEFLHSVDYRRSARRPPTGEEADAQNLPLVISVTSETDWATRSMFPLGMAIKSLGETFRPYECGRSFALPRLLYTHTPGHTPQLFSHTVTEVTDIVRPNLRAPAEGEIFRECKDILESPEPGTCFTFRTKKDGKHRWYVIKREVASRNISAYWILQVPGTLIPNHSKIFGEGDDIGGALLRLVDVLAKLGGVFEDSERPPITPSDELGRFPLQPAKIAALPSGAVAIVTSEQSLWRLDPKTSTLSKNPLCLPLEVHGYEVAAMAADVAGPDEEVVLALRRRRMAARHIYEWNIVRASWQGDRWVIDRGRSEFYPDVTQQPYGLATRNGRTFLTTGRSAGVVEIPVRLGRSWGAALNGRSGTFQLGPLALTSSARLAFAADEATGALYAIDTTSGRVRPILAPGHLKRPTALTVADDRLFVADAEADTLWSIRCIAGHCQEPERFGPQHLLQDPVAVTADTAGDVWVIDRGRKTLFRVHRDGRSGGCYSLRDGADPRRVRETRLDPCLFRHADDQNCIVSATSHEPCLP